MKLLILLVTVVGIIAVAQLAKIYQLSARLRGHREEDISEADTRLQGSLWIVFMFVLFGTTIWQFVRYGDYLPPSASLHGEAVDMLMGYNLALVIVVFFVVNALIFIFSFKYRFDKNRTAHFFPHDTRLEVIWTVIPSIVLAVIIIYGLQTWSEMTGPASDDSLRVELYSKQFDWTARYAGDNDEFGSTNFNLITPLNPLGIVTQEGIDQALLKIEDKIVSDSCEALLGAIYLEKGFNIVEKVILNLWKKNIKKSVITQIDAKTKLQEFALKNFKKLPTYKLISNLGPRHKPLFKIGVKLPTTKYFIASGKSKKDAEQNAAIECLKSIK